MGREIRKVPANWQHPQDKNGKYKPLYNEYYADALSEWFNNHNLWLEGKHADQQEGGRSEYKFYAEWDGNPPDVDYYLHDKWSDEEANCFQMYETVSEGTPVSPIFESLEQLENWLIQKGYSPIAAKAFCEQGWAPSMTFTPANGLRDGISSYED